MAWFMNYYQCRCGNIWTGEWSYNRDDRCMGCYKMVTPNDDDDLSIIVQAWRVVTTAGGNHVIKECADMDAEKFVVLRSADDADDEPSYRIVAEFPATQWVRSWADHAADMVRCFGLDVLSHEQAEMMIHEQIIDKCQRRGVNTKAAMPPACAWPPSTISSGRP